MKKENIIKLLKEIEAASNKNTDKKNLTKEVKTLELKIKRRYNQMLENFSIYIDSDNLYLANIVINEQYRSMKYGSKIIKMLINFCNTHNILLFLIPSDEFDYKRVTKFYRRLGFRKNIGIHKNSTFNHMFDKSSIMYINPPLNKT